MGAPYCKYCDWMKPAWDQLALGLQHDRSVVVAHMNGTLDRDFAANLGVRTFPTVLAFPKTGGAPFVYGSQVRGVARSLVSVWETWLKETRWTIRMTVLVKHETPTACFVLRARERTWRSWPWSTFLQLLTKFHPFGSRARLFFT